MEIKSIICAFPLLSTGFLTTKWQLECKLLGVLPRAVIDGLLDSDDENYATNDSSDIVEAGMDDGEFDEVSSSSDDSFSEGEELVDDSVVAGPSSRRLRSVRRSSMKEIKSDVSETSESSDRERR